MAVSSTASNLARQKVEMDMTPMIDVTFLLLIFFMCTLNFKTLEGKLLANLPKDEGLFSVPSQKPEEPITIKLLKTQGETAIWVGGSKLLGSGKFDTLFNKVDAIINRTPDVPAVIDPDIEVPFQDIIATLNVIRKVSRKVGKSIEIKFAAKNLNN